MEIDQLLLDAVRDGIRKGIVEKLNSGYNNPIAKLLEEVITSRRDEIRDLLESAISSATTNAEFCEEIRVGVRSTMARMLVQRFGGELEKQVNALKSDPTTRSRITLAIEEIVKQKA